MCDFTGRIEKDGEKVAASRGAAHRHADRGGRAGIHPGFTEQLVGMRPGRADDPRPPPRGYGAADLAGREAFEVTAKALKKPVLPPVMTSWPALGFADLAALMTEVKASLQRDLDRLSRLRVKRALLDALAERADFPVPRGW